MSVRKTPTSNEVEASQQQLALDIFSSMEGGRSITEIPSDFGFRKSSALVDVSDLGLLSRKALNGCFFLAQSDPQAEMHSYDLRFFKWLIGFDSRDNRYLLSKLREAQKSSLLISIIDPNAPSDYEGASVPMLGPVGIRDGKVFFEIPKPLRSQISDPGRYGYLSMRIQANFTSLYALKLYERLSIFRDDGCTPLWTIEELQEAIKAEDLKIAQEFKYLRDRIIQPAVEQINTYSDLDVSYELKRTGRCYSHIRFLIKLSKGHKLLSNIEESKQLYEALIHDFGISDADLDEISNNRDEWGGDERLKTTIDFVRHQMKTTTIKFPGKYLMKMLRDGFRVSDGQRSELENRKKESKRRAVEQAAVKRVRQRAAPSAKKIQLPEGQVLEDAWNLFRQAPSVRLLYKTLPTQFEQATARQKMSFELFWAEQQSAS